MNLSINSTTKVDFSKWYYVEDAFSVEEIDKIHGLADKVAFEKATIITNSPTDDTYRKSDVKWLNSEINGIDWLYEKLKKIIVEANDSLWQFDMNEDLGKLQYGFYLDEPIKEFKKQLIIKTLQSKCSRNY